MSDERAQASIGVFDSGLGGLTVARAIRARLPDEHLVYLGDTARVPYGSRSAQTVIRYARGCAAHLERHGVKMLVIACNTVSAVAVPMLQVELDVPVVGVVEPGAAAAVEATRKGRVGVLATRGTVASGAYVRAVSALDSRVEVVQEPAPLLVPLAEEGWTEGDVPRQVARRYLETLAPHQIDAVVLGCTHYPLLRSVIEEEGRAILGDELAVVDGAEATAQAIETLLDERDLRRTAGSGGLRVMVTDLPDRFQEVASRFLGADVGEVEAVDL
ncbi:MAG: glutamate racemase [Sandaracinus sp.]|nr:glutamate racemase [Sandaracinus sp.]